MLYPSYLDLLDRWRMEMFYVKLSFLCWLQLRRVVQRNIILWDSDKTTKARMFYSCERLVFHSFNVYPLGTFRYTDSSWLGWYDVIMIYVIMIYVIMIYDIMIYVIMIYVIMIHVMDEKCDWLTDSIIDHCLLFLELLSRLNMWWIRTSKLFICFELSRTGTSLTLIGLKTELSLQTINKPFLIWKIRQNKQKVNFSDHLIYST